MMNASIDIRDALFDEVYKIGKKDRDFLFIADDMDAFSLKKFKKDLGKQYINIGVAEQNMIDVAAGLAAVGKTVCCFGISSYVTTRCYEQIKFSLCSMNLPVIIIGIGAGFSFNFDGPSHQGTIDIGVMRLLPGITILNPSDQTSAAQSVDMAYRLQSPTYIRLDKGNFPQIYSKAQTSKGYKVIKPLKDFNIISTGVMTSQLIDILEVNNINNVGLVDVFQLKPINPDIADHILSKSKKILVIEEHSILGGLATITSELITNNNLHLYFENLGIDDHQFDVFGSRDWLRSLNNLDKKSIFETIKRINEL